MAFRLDQFGFGYPYTGVDASVSLHDLMIISLRFTIGTRRVGLGSTFPCIARRVFGYSFKGKANLVGLR